MSDRDLRKILDDVITDIDQGRLRPLTPLKKRARVGGAALAAALGIGLALSGCDAEAVGTASDGSVAPDVTQVDPPDAAPDPTPDAAPDPDAATVIVLDGGPVDLYMAIDLDDAGIEAEDGSVDDLDGDINIGLYAAPMPEKY